MPATWSMRWLADLKRLLESLIEKAN